MANLLNEQDDFNNYITFETIQRLEDRHKRGKLQQNSLNKRDFSHQKQKPPDPPVATHPSLPSSLKRSGCPRRPCVVPTTHQQRRDDLNIIRRECKQCLVNKLHEDGAQDNKIQSIGERRQHLRIIWVLIQLELKI